MNTYLIDDTNYVRIGGAIQSVEDNGRDMVIRSVQHYRDKAGLLRERVVMVAVRLPMSPRESGAILWAGRKFEVTGRLAADGVIDAQGLTEVTR